VAFIGFAPGFAYLVGGDKRLAVPRRQRPRVRVPAGSVAIAGPYSGVYPRDTPGGWQLLGRTSVSLFDAQGSRPALLAVGDLVRFFRL
jgi:KipI family sensor histidine kinase inhibitor